MRLLNTFTLKLEEFFEQNLPEYAILSHTWGEGEVTLQELQRAHSVALAYSLTGRFSRWNHVRNPILRSLRQGFRKVLCCALQARKDGYKYIWCDTCCIDKTNIAELSEAINSMYYWYEQSTICYAYLADVPHSLAMAHLDKGSAFAKSRWFTRGWTLQELIGPRELVFFDESWNAMGTKHEFRKSISEWTGIDEEVLLGHPPGLCSIANRMSWASQRETTRLEDTAYCLIGLFKVNMPLLYGERERAFLRLQEEIMRKSRDHSLFAWRVSETLKTQQGGGLLASSPARFRESRNVVPLVPDKYEESVGPLDPYFLTNMGVSITLPLVGLEETEPYHTFFAALDCQDTTDARGPLGLRLHRNKEGIYSRYPQDLLLASNLRTSKKYKAERICIEARGSRADQFVSYIATAEYKFHFVELSNELSIHGLHLRVFPIGGFWDPETNVLSCGKECGGAVYIGQTDGAGLVFLVGIDPGQLRPRCLLYSEAGLGKCEEVIQRLVTGEQLEEKGLFGFWERSLWERWNVVCDHSEQSTSGILQLPPTSRPYQGKSQPVWELKPVIGRIMRDEFTMFSVTFDAKEQEVQTDK